MPLLPHIQQIPRILSRSSLRPGYCQKRWAQVQDVRFLATQNVQERTIEKYRDQLERRAREEGHESIEGLKDAYKEKIQELRKKAAVPGATAPLDTAQAISPKADSKPAASSAPSQDTTKASSPRAPSSFPKANSSVKPLSSYLDLEKISDLPTSQIEPLWRLRHAHKEQSLSFAVPADTWGAIVKMARQHPQFVLPLPREVPVEDGSAAATAGEAQASNAAAEIHFMQWNFPTEHAVTVLFTHLAEYKLRGEYANAHTTVTFHTELAQTKGLVLGQGTVMQGRGVTVDEGKWLLMCMQKFYGVQAEQRAERKRLLESFTRGDSTFELQTLLDEAERI
ncbi:ATP11-domain-containing protein [Pseudovirgaria hyperparasitica]|uniref:ATP11-domain-containing protein n=1 Tax=Pseudovirgaria hyperparasitica TaxID=470096 RepID=A0A6A6W9R3_9PEZI|nr:ATP11-domain-containing protein [Pseudovirgaria hyperparasitica]KAF2759305.1 ATP11-domain-containing protein [Pseudovirgaria hyperparasitica]